MTLIFKLFVIFVFLAHTALIMYILYKLDGSYKLDGRFVGDFFCVALWSAYVIFLACVIFMMYVEEEGVNYGEISYSGYLYPFQSSCGDSVYLEKDCKTYRFKISEDSIICTYGSRCLTDCIGDGDTSFYECVSMVAEPWVLNIITPEHKYLQPRYILHVPSGGECEIPCEELPESCWGWDVPPY